MKHPIDEKVGARIRYYRVAEGLKQRELAQRLGISYQQVQKYEMGKDKVSLVRLFAVAEVLGIGVHCLLDIEQPVPDKTRSARQALALMQYFTAISSTADRQHVIEIARILSEKGILT